MSAVGDKVRALVERMRAERPVIPNHKVRRVFPPPPPPPVVVKNNRTALRSIMDRPFCQSVKYGEQQWRAPREGAHPSILDFSDKLVRYMRVLDVPMFPYCFVRSSAEQDAAYAAGNSKAQAGESPHNYGMAVDIIHGRYGWEIDKAAWAMIGHIGKEIAAKNGLKLTWGGDWKFYDPAHWELSEWRSIIDQR